MPSELPSLKSKLPYTTRVGVAQWRYRESSLTVSLRRWTNAIELPESIAPPDVLKLAPRRLVFGDESAPYLVVEFADFECPYCGIVAPELKKLIEKDTDIQLKYLEGQ